jgi:hypothetical protein
MNDLEFLVTIFITHAGTPEDARKLLLQRFPVEVVDKAYEEFRKRAGNRKYISPPPMLVKSKRHENEWYIGGDTVPNAKFWPALRNHLLNEKRWPQEAVQSINDASDKIVAWMESPWAAKIQTRGLVVGYVQSGKTSNFTAVIAKAADAGYKFFIVLSGTKKSLRSQTQQRLSKELISLNTDSWFSPTINNDFEATGSNVNYFLTGTHDKKVLCVVKKNVKRLEHLINWLKSASSSALQECPFLIIDDEADEASVNTAPDQVAQDPEEVKRTRINARLVDLLELLPKASYIGYTATPFANIFIDPSSPKDLYPRDFIVSLPKPKGHFGTEQIFGRSRLLDDETDEEYRGLDMVRIIPDDEVASLKPASKKHDFTPQVTDSLAKALRYFWMACSARICRGSDHEFSTMLIHTSERVYVHNSMRDQVEEYRQQILHKVKARDRSLFALLKAEWNDEASRVSSSEMKEIPLSFDQISENFLLSVEKTAVVADNFQSMYRLSYETKGSIQIAIGGNTLSRGLTLEGLIVSYFVRSAKTYDTLLQMGRWFGYRPGYSDLPRLWMTEELYNNFYELATIEAEMRRNIEDYDKLSITPLQFGVRVRTSQHLNITASLKMQHAVKAQVSYGADRVQTVLFEHKNTDLLAANISVTDGFIKKLFESGSQPQQQRSHLIFRDIPATSVLPFINSYGFHPNNRTLSSKLLTAYIRDQNKHGLLNKWNVVIRGLVGKAPKKRGFINLGGISVPLLERARRKTPIEYAHIGTLMSKGDTGADLLSFPVDIKNIGEDQLMDMREEQMPGVGLLVIYPISKDSKRGINSADHRDDLGAANHVIGLGFVFPEAQGESLGAQEYITVDPTKLDLSGFEIEEEEEDEE